MKLAQQQQRFQQLTEQLKAIMLKKGNDYANEDRLSNFKAAGYITNTSTSQACLNLIAIKVARLGVLIGSGNDPNNESVQDSVIDLIAYGFLLDAILNEKE